MVINPSKEATILNVDRDPERLQIFSEIMNECFIKSIRHNQNGSFSSAHAVIQEIHPYLGYRNEMVDTPCGYIIGTFPPSGYLRNQNLINEDPIRDRRFTVADISVPKSPCLDFFHGNRNSYWEYLGINEISRPTILSFLKKFGWVYSDIIYSCTRTNIDKSGDNYLRDVVPNFELLQEILERTDSPKLWFQTSGVFNQDGINVLKRTAEKGRVNTRSGRAYDIFLRTLQNLGKKLEVRLDNQDTWVEVNYTNHAVLKEEFSYQFSHFLRIDESQVYEIYTGPSPSAAANPPLRNNRHFVNWRSGYNGTRTDTEEFRFIVYNSFIRQELPFN